MCPFGLQTTFGKSQDSQHEPGREQRTVEVRLETGRGAMDAGDAEGYDDYQA